MPFKFFARYVKAKPIDTSGLLTLLYLKSDSKDTTLQVIKNYVFLQPIVHKPLG